jgi:hypothetical protein
MLISTIHNHEKTREGLQAHITNRMPNHNNGFYWGRGYELQIFSHGPFSRGQLVEVSGVWTLELICVLQFLLRLDDES